MPFENIYIIDSFKQSSDSHIYILAKQTLHIHHFMMAPTDTPPFQLEAGSNYLQPNLISLPRSVLFYDSKYT